VRAGASTFDLNNRLWFGEPDVARCYAYRPPYAQALYERVLGLVPGRDCLLDLGCGPGKIAHALATHFQSVVAVDPSRPMLDAARLGKGYANVVWVLGSAEDIDPDRSFDLITIGAAVHWLPHEIVFPRMTGWLKPDGVLAIIDGDGQHQPPWQDVWLTFLKAWLRKIGSEYDQKAFTAAGQSYTPWMDIEGRESFVAPFRQTIGEFVECQHSRATWARENMGPELARLFDLELRETLSPFATDSWLEFDVKSNLVWGRPRQTKKEVAA
jgi:SAM-dependent methyltransferase